MRIANLIIHKSSSYFLIIQKAKSEPTIGCHSVTSLKLYLKTTDTLNWNTVVMLESMIHSYPQFELNQFTVRLKSFI